MKKIYSLIVGFIFLLTVTKAQYVTIPDDNFRNFLLAKYPSCFDDGTGRLNTTCSAVANEDSLNISGLEIANIEGIEYFTSLTYLDCSNNVIVITTFNPITLEPASPALPNSITHLNYSKAGAGDGDPFVTLPILPDHLTYLDYSHNYTLTGGPSSALPGTLTYLDCSYDGLYNLPALPPNLTYLNCSGQGDATLETSPTVLSALPDLPKSLTYLDCSNNELSSLPALPNSLKTLNCSNAYYRDYLQTYPTLFCLPVLPASLTSLTCDTNIHCLPNLVPGLQTNLPVCNPTNDKNHCQGFPTISGNIFYDINGNGIKDAGEIYAPKVKVQLSNSTYTFTNDSGYYKISPDSIGNFTLSVNTPVYYQAIPDPVNYSFSSYDTSISNANIALQATAIADSLQISVTPLTTRAVPGGDFPYLISYTNIGTTTLLSNVVFNYSSILLNYNNSNNVSVVDNGSNLSLSGVNLDPGESNSFIADFTLKTTDVAGEVLFTNAQISANATSALDSSTVVIRSSFDPNDKEATSQLTPFQVSEGKAINYIVHFQNTGTAAANNIVIADTLSNLLDAGSVQVSASSQPCTVTINGNIVFFEFLNVVLPDSTDDLANSHGFVSFSVKPLSSVSSGSINNTASIYFDYNPPVVTNTTSTLVQDSNIIIPVRLIRFNVLTQPGSKNNLLNWITANEINTKSFDVEQSVDGTGFYSIGTVAAKGFGGHSYSFNATENASVVYYRINMIDVNGNYNYSIIITVNSSDNAGFIVLTNPARKWISIKTTAPALTNSVAKILNSEGAVVKNFALQQGVQTIDVSEFSAGLYYIQTQLGTKKVVISK